MSGLALFLLSLILTPERRVASDGPPINAPYRSDSIVTVAGPNGASLILWRDGRQDNNADAVVATRISAAGEILDPLGIVIDAGAFAGSAAWNGRDYVIVTTGDRARSWLLSPDGTHSRPPIEIGTGVPQFAVGNGRDVVVTYDFALVFLNDAGAVDKTIVLPSNFGTIEAVAPLGNDFIVIMSSFRSPEMQWLRVNRSGIILSRRFGLYPAHDLRSRVRAASSGAAILLTWESWPPVDSEYDTNALLMTVDGFVAFNWQIRKEHTTFFPFSPRPPSATWDGHSFIVGWRQLAFASSRPALAQEFRVSRITPGEAAIPPPRIVDRFAPSGNDFPPPEVLWSGQQLVVAWKNELPTLADADVVTRVAPNVESIDAAPARIASLAPANEQSVRAAAGGDGGLFTVWREGGTIGRIIGELTRADGTKSGRIAVSASANPSDLPVVAWAGGEYLVVWREDRGTSNDREFFGIIGRRYDVRGEPLDAAPAVLALDTISPPSISLARRIALASNGESFLAAWVGGFSAQDVYATLVAPSGSASAPIRIPTAEIIDEAMAPGVFVEGEKYIVFWSEVDGGYARASSAAISKSGVLVEPQHTTYVRVKPDPARFKGIIPFEVVSNGSEIVTTYRRLPAGCVYAVRTDLLGVPIFIDGQQVACGTEPAEARGFWDGSRFWVVYSLPGKLQAVPIDATGAPVGAPITLASEGSAFDPFVVTTRRGFTILYNRPDAASHHVRRAFQRSLLFPRMRVAGQ